MPVAFGLLWIALHGRRARAGFGLGLLFGLGQLLPLLHWTGIYVGPGPWLALVLLEALFIGLAGLAITYVGTLPLAPLWAAGLWVGAEALRARWPFDGFSWGKVAFGQPEGAFLPLVAIGGTALLGFAVVLAGFGVGELARRIGTRTRGPRRLVWPVLFAALPPIAGLIAGPLVTPHENAGTATVAVIQGNVPRLGLDFNAQRRAVLDNHVKRTLQLAQDVAAGRQQQPDLVIWPENSSDIDPFQDPIAFAELNQAAAAIKAPIAVGAVLSLDSTKPTNTVLLWQPGQGATDRYTKQHIQPFGEYMPLRSVIRLFSSYVDQVSWDFQPGDKPGVFAMGPARVGIATCYEVAFDDIVTDTVRSGAQILAIPSNNATFGLSEMTFQQLAMSRVRAVEHGTAVLVAATSGVSAIIGPDGSVTQSTGQFVPDALVGRVPLRSTTTLATSQGSAPEWFLTGLGIAGLALAAARTRRSLSNR
ncbi:apolipoprotein N-acyltransferase [Pseudonocardiaceae bacterium YIM PH 21723]|nr:apolipoprotein N-acyltransferase [Pseudonocardiaceae bacterium YIM PH 21723]